MVDEYLSEREQAEQLRRWLRENWIWLVAGVVLTLAAYYGYRWWEARAAARSVAAGERFEAMLEAIASGKREDGLEIAAEVTGEYADTPYADQATLVLSRLDVDSGNYAAAEAKLAKVASGSRDPELSIGSRRALYSPSKTRLPARWRVPATVVRISRENSSKRSHTRVVRRRAMARSSDPFRRWRGCAK